SSGGSTFLFGKARACLAAMARAKRRGNAMSAPDHTVLQEAVRWLDQGRKVALATVIETWGSAPQPVGSQLAIDSAGNFVGSVSGGCVEGEVVSEAQDVIASELPKILS